MSRVIIFLCIIATSLYADFNTSLKNLEIKIYKIEQENIKITKKINLANIQHKYLEESYNKIIENNKKDNILLIKNFVQELNSNNWIPIVIAFLAFLVSFISVLISFKKAKLKVEVIPVSENITEHITHTSENYYNKNKSTEYFGVKIINHSSFNINISHIAFHSEGDKNQYTPNGGFYTFYKEEQKFPLKIEEKNSVTIYFEIADFMDMSSDKISIKVVLSTNENIFGTSKALKELIQSKY